MAIRPLECIVSGGRFVKLEGMGISEERAKTLAIYFPLAKANAPKESASRRIYRDGFLAKSTTPQMELGESIKDDDSVVPLGNCTFAYTFDVSTGMIIDIMKYKGDIRDRDFSFDPSNRMWDATFAKGILNKRSEHFPTALKAVSKIKKQGYKMINAVLQYVIENSGELGRKEGEFDPDTYFHRTCSRIADVGQANMRKAIEEHRKNGSSAKY